MRNVSLRTAFISGAAIAGAMIWGAAEFLALQLSRLEDRLRTLGRFRAF